MKFLPFICKSLILAQFLGKKTNCTPQTTFLATPLRLQLFDWQKKFGEIDPW